MEDWEEEEYEDEMDEPYPFYEEEESCANCLRATAMEECGRCGAALCPMCFECSVGVCDRCIEGGRRRADG